jgi:hypothetical protein
MAVTSLCKYSDAMLFSSTPDDFTEVTHLNVEPVEYWVKPFVNISGMHIQRFVLWLQVAI